MTHQHRKKRHGWAITVVAVLSVVAVIVLAWPRDGDRGPATGSPAPSVTDTSATASVERDTTGIHGPQEINLEAPATARRLTPVRLVGDYPAAESGTSLRVQLLETGGSWMSFPLPTVVDESGRFATYVELGRPGSNRLRVIDPASGATSGEVSIQVSVEVR